MKLTSAWMVAERLLPGVVVCLLLIVLTGCSQSPATREAIEFAVDSLPQDFDPRYATDASSERVNALLYDSLVEFDGQRLPVSGLASWQQLALTTYRFDLNAWRRDFTDGQPLTADDVVATYRSVLDPANLSPHRGTLELIASVEKIDADSVLFELHHADPLFPAYLRVGILPARLLAAGHNFSTQPLGSGAFELVKRDKQQQVEIRRRDDGQLIVFNRVKDPTVRALKLLNGETDILQNDLPPEIAAYLMAREDVRHARLAGSNFSYLGFNLADRLTGNPLIRRAIAHGIDRQAIIRHVFQQAAVPAKSLLPPGHWAGHDDLPGIDYDPDIARQLLQQAGYDYQHRLQLSYKTSTDPFRIRLATILQSQLREIGIDLEIRSYDWGTFFGDIKAGRFQLYSLSWVGINTPDIFRYVFHSTSLPPDGANRGRYHSPRVDRLLDDLPRAAELDQQQLIYYQVQEVLHQDLPYVPLWYEHQQVFHNPRIAGYRLFADGSYASLVDVSIRNQN